MLILWFPLVTMCRQVRGRCVQEILLAGVGGGEAIKHGMQRRDTVLNWGILGCRWLLKNDRNSFPWFWELRSLRSKWQQSRCLVGGYFLVHRQCFLAAYLSKESRVSLGPLKRALTLISRAPSPGLIIFQRLCLLIPLSPGISVLPHESGKDSSVWIFFAWEILPPRLKTSELLNYLIIRKTQAGGRRVRYCLAVSGLPPYLR